MPLFALAAPSLSPERANPGERTVFTLRVTAEREAPLIEVRVFVLRGVTEVTPSVKPGWNVEITPGIDGSVTEIAWSGGSIPRGYRDTFEFEATVKDTATSLSWPMVEVYEDGTILTWDAAPGEGNVRPAPETAIVIEETGDDWYAKGAFALAFLALLLAVGSILRHF